MSIRAMAVRLRTIALWAMLMMCTCRAGAADPWEQLARAAADHDKASARKTLEALLLEQPTFNAGHFNLGTLLIDTDPDAAATHLELASASSQIELAADALHNLALVRWKQGRLEDAVDAAGRACKLRSDDHDEQKLLSELRRVLIIRADQARRTAEEEAKKLHFGSLSLPDAHALEPYDAHILAAGGHGAYRFSLGAISEPTTPIPSTPQAPAAPVKPAPSPLPAGLTLDGDGRLHGTPSKPGRFDIPIALVDDAGKPVTSTLTLTVHPAPAITTARLPEAVLSSPYHAELASEGLDNPHWTISGLPPGLAPSSSSGASIDITGSASRAGTYSLHVNASDAHRHADRTVELVVTDLFAADPSVLPPATAWAAYTQKESVLGPAQRYQWTANPQGGLQLAPDGTVSGTPDKAGEHTLDATITAEDGRKRVVTLNLLVNPPPVIEESAPISLTVGQAVERPVKIAGGTPPFQWSITEGVLPKGIRLDPDGALRGVGTEIGKAEITLSVADRWLSTTQQKLTVTVAAADPKKDQKKPDDKKNDQNQEAQKNRDDQKKNQDDQKKQEDHKQGDQKQQDQANKNGQKSDPQKDHNGSSDQKQDQQKQQANQDANQHNDQKSAQQDHSGANQDHGAAHATAAQEAARQAQAINQAAADRWLDQLPKENRSVLRYQLLDGGDAQPQYKGKTW